MTNAEQFLGMEPRGDDLHWQLTVVPELTTPGHFLFGGCGLGAALVALEKAASRPTVWRGRNGTVPELETERGAVFRVAGLRKLVARWQRQPD